MNGHLDASQTAKQWAVDMLRGNPHRTEDDIRATVEKAVQAVRLFGSECEVDAEQLVAELLHTFSISADRGSLATTTSAPPRGDQTTSEQPSASSVSCRASPPAAAMRNSCFGGLLLPVCFVREA